MATNFPTLKRTNPAADEDSANTDRNAKRFGVISFFTVSAGLFLIFWGISSGDFRTAENVWTARFCLVWALGAALILSGVFLRSALKISAFWLGLAIAGQAASLQLIDAGRLIRFQHYRAIAEWSKADFLPLALLLLQIGFVVFSISKKLPEIGEFLARTFKTRQLILFAVFLTLADAALSKDFSIYATDLAFAAVIQTISAANIILFAWSLPAETLSVWQRKIRSFLSESATVKRPRLDGFSLIAALFVVIFAAALGYFVYENHPHVPDEAQYLFQAKYFAAGQLTVKAPLVPEAFSLYMVPQNESRWFAIFPPGWAAMLAVGLKLHIFWLVNPMLAGICILLAYLFFQDIYSRRVARLAIVLLCCSPWFIFMAMSLMSHISTLACALAAAVLVLRGFKSREIKYFFAAGLFVGFVSLIRPLDGAIIAILLGVWTLMDEAQWRKRILNAAILTVGTICSAALVLPYNFGVTGNAMLSPMDAYYARYFSADVMNLGFGANRGFNWGLDAFPGHSPFEALINAALNVFQVNTELFGWATGSLILMIYFILSGAWRKKDFWSFSVIGSVIFAYSFFWYHGGPDFGARYWFLIIIPLVGLTARSIESLSESLDETGEVNNSLNPRIVAAIGMLCVLTLFNYFPWRALDKYFHYLEMQPGIEELARENDFGKSLVLIRGAEYPDYASAWVYNPPDFEGDAPIFAWDKTADVREKLLRSYPERRAWIVDAPTLTGGGYKIVQRPVYTIKNAANRWDYRRN